jgi:hypothetical protein
MLSCDTEWIYYLFWRDEYLRYVGGIGNFDRLALLQISTIFTIFHSFYLAGQTTKCCGRFNVSMSCAL